MKTASFHMKTVTAESGVVSHRSSFHFVPSRSSCSSPSQISSLLLSTTVNQLCSPAFSSASFLTFTPPRALRCSFMSFCSPGQKHRGSCLWPFSLDMKRLVCVCVCACLQRHYDSATTMEVTDTVTAWTWALFIVSVEPSLTGWETDELVLSSRPILKEHSECLGGSFYQLMAVING